MIMKSKIIVLGLLTLLLLSGCKKEEKTVITSKDALRVESTEETLSVITSRAIRLAEESGLK